MPNEKIQQKALWKNSSELATSGMFTELINCYIDLPGHVVQRVGYESYFNVGEAPIDGLYWWSKEEKYIIVSGGVLYTSDIDGNVTTCTGDTPVDGIRVTFATDGTFVFIANGGRILKLDSSDVGMYLADGDVPTNVSHVIFFDLYLLCNSVGTGKIYWSDVNDYINWNPLNFASAESNPDDIYALVTSWRELLLVGDKTIETWYDDGISPFSRIEGGFIEDGSKYPYTIQKIDNTFYYLNTDGKIVSISNRVPTVLSLPIDRELQTYSTLDGAYSFLFSVSGRYFYCISFPSENITWAYDLVSKGWARWSYYDITFAREDIFKASCSVYVPKLNQWVMGDNSTGNVYKVSQDIYEDDTNVIRSRVRTGYISHGSLARKRNKELLFRIRRGEVSVADAQFMVKWRTDTDKWSNEIWYTVGNVGDESTIKLSRTGIYNTRQYEFVFTGNLPFTLIEVEEEFEFLGR